MRLGGFLPLSLCDYPGKLAAVVFTQGCNYRCPFCHNGGLIAEKPATNLSVTCMLADLERRRSFLDAVVVSGGEPTLHCDLDKFLAALHGLGYAVKLDTNGSRPDVLRRLFDLHLVDYVAMDVKAPLSRYSALAGVSVDLAAIQESIRLIAESGIPHRFRTTWVSALLSSEEQGEIQALVPVGSIHRFQEFRPESALDEALRIVRWEETKASTPSFSIASQSRRTYLFG